MDREGYRRIKNSYKRIRSSYRRNIYVSHLEKDLRQRRKVGRHRSERA